jgi:rhamnulokinase
VSATDLGPTRAYLAIDLGASSGRAMLGTLRKGVVSIRELHRFPTPLVERGGHLFWDAAALWAEVQKGLGLALEMQPGLASISVDSWAVDYVPVDAAGEPLRDPYAYRDPRTRGRLAQAFKRVPAAEIYRRTGIQMQEFNTLVQILVDSEAEPFVVERTADRLGIAEYLLFRLSGKRVAERTNASTTQLVDVRTGEWDVQLMSGLGLPETGWPAIVPPGTVLGPLRVEGDAVGDTVVVASCAHDTAAAVAAVPADPKGPAWAYLSTGTWALLGVERAEPIVSDAALAANFTNEAGLDGTVRFLKNLMGMWVLQECEREWRAAEPGLDFGGLLARAAAAPAPSATIDFGDGRFTARGDMPARIDGYCERQGLPVPASRAEMVRLVLESLAATYGATLRELESLTGEKVGVLHLVGGASRNFFFCQLIAEACGVEVVAGPVEAAALGNVLVQARTLGDLAPGVSIRETVRQSVDLRSYRPAR